MAFKHGKGGHFAITDSGATERNVSPYCDDVKIDLDIANPITTTFGSNGQRRQVVGLKDSKITVSGKHDTTALVGSWTVFTGLYGLAAASTYKWGPEGSTAGLPRVTGAARMSKYGTGSKVDGVVPFTAELEGDDVATIDTF